VRHTVDERCGGAILMCVCMVAEFALMFWMRQKMTHVIKQRKGFQAQVLGWPISWHVAATPSNDAAH